MTAHASPRIVSLVPSDTHCVATLGGLHRLIGRTNFCVAPAPVLAVPPVGGPKKVNVEAVVHLRPDLVLANREENSRDDVVSIERNGLPVLLTLPKRVEHNISHLDLLAERTGLSAHWQSIKSNSCKALETILDHRPQAQQSCFVPVWKDPWMTVTDDTYLGDVLRVLGFHNIYGNVAVTDDASRYPRIELAEALSKRPDVILLPDEPFPFSETHAQWLRDKTRAWMPTILNVDGRDLCWPGTWALDAIPRLASLIKRTRKVTY